MRVFTTLMSWSNEKKSCIRVYELTSESLHESLFNSHGLFRQLNNSTTIINSDSGATPSKTIQYQDALNTKPQDDIYEYLASNINLP